MSENHSRTDARNYLIAECYRRACYADVQALKPGNVSVGRPAHGMSAKDFFTSARLTAPVFARYKPLQEGSLGACILECATLTMSKVGCNTNLGILLLCCPLAQAAASCETSGGIPKSLARVLGSTSVKDAQSVFDAILTMQPAGLGSSEQHDVRSPASAGLVEAMKSAASRDRIAWQYANNFRDIFLFVESLLLGNQLLNKNKQFSGNKSDPLSEEQVLRRVASRVFMDLLCEFPDSHIYRKHGATMAEAVRDEARTKRNLLNSSASEAESQTHLGEFDRELKKRNVNPGTSADLTVAVLFAALLETELSDSGLLE